MKNLIRMKKMSNQNETVFIVKTYQTFEVWHKVSAENDEEAIVKAVASDRYVTRTKFPSCSEDDAEAEPLREHNEYLLDTDLGDDSW